MKRRQFLAISAIAGVTLVQAADQVEYTVINTGSGVIPLIRHLNSH